MNDAAQRSILASLHEVKEDVIADILPPPDQLAITEDGNKVTISLSRRSVDFSKAAAEQNQTSYQRMIRRLLDTYADRCRGDLTKRYASDEETAA